jgi:hypothetical protein
LSTAFFASVMLARASSTSAIARATALSNRRCVFGSTPPV